MLTKLDLLTSFSVVEESDFGHYFFQHKLPKVTYQYYLKSSNERDFLVVSESVVDRQFAVGVLDCVPHLVSPVKPVIFELAENQYGFTHSIVVPSTFHSSLKGGLESKRKNLHLCIPIYRCEFSGTESESEFKEMMSRTVPVFRWPRQAVPKLRVYFDNPATGAGTYENGALLKLPTLLSEIENLNGVVSGFIEVTNYEGSVVEVLSPVRGAYTLIHDRTHEEKLDFFSLVEAISSFAGMKV